MNWLQKTTLAAASVTFALPAQAAVVIASGTPGTTGQTALYMTNLSEISAEAGSGADTAELQSFLGAPDDSFTGLGEYWVTYDLGGYRLVDGTGDDLTVYEVDGGVVEFNRVAILVSGNGVDFFDISTTATLGGVDLAGDEAHGSASFRRSYDVGGAVSALATNQFRFVRIEGTASGLINASNDFDLDAVGYANFTFVGGGVPEPSVWALLIIGFGAAGAAMRRRGYAALSMPRGSA